MKDSQRKYKDNALKALAKGKFKRALSEYAKAAELDPSDLNTQQNMAHLYSKLGKKKEAASIYKLLDRMNKKIVIIKLRKWELWMNSQDSVL